MTSIRVKVIGVARKEDKILAGLYEHPSTGFKFYCPIGGGMELGERSEETLHREFNEEIKAKLSFQKLLGVLENHFELEGRVGHEIVYVYQVEFKDKSLYAKSSIAAIEDNGYELGPTGSLFNRQKERRFSIPMDWKICSHLLLFSEILFRAARILSQTTAKIHSRKGAYHDSNYPNDTQHELVAQHSCILQPNKFQEVLLY